ncbi:MAG TPA: tetratricopeptide repeat protein [Flavipsychrobacter sp.]|nr:tetratricopeptide repeat protein [Flavipsychrobacter sp.]
MKNFFLFVFLCLPFRALAQSPEGADSLLRVLSAAKEDTNKVKLLFSLSDKYETSEPDKAKAFCRQAGELSKKLNYDPGVMKSYRYIAYIFSYQARFDSSLHYNQLSLDLALQKKDTFNIGVSLFNIGEAYKYLAEYEKGLEYTLKGISMLEGKGYTNIESNLYGGLQNTYILLKQYDKAAEYGRKAVALGRKLQDKGPLLSALANLANVNGELGKHDEARRLYTEAISLAKQLNNLSVEAMCYEGMTDVSLQQKRYEDIALYAGEALKLHTQIQNQAGIMAANQGLSLYYLIKKDFRKAEEHAMTSLNIARKENYMDVQPQLMNTLSSIYFAMHDFDKGFKFGKESNRASENIFTETLAEKDAHMRVKYETEKKEAKIKLQEAIIRQKNTLNYILIGGAASLLIIALLLYRNYRHRQTLQQQRISELETEKQLAATEAIIKGEEQERSRLAKDLHDGLGGMLSGIKYSLTHMKENLIMTPANAQAFEHSINMLDNSIREMRRVAHNLMPEALLKFGLDDALKDFCSEMNRNGMLKVMYQSPGLKEVAIEQSLAVTVYRVTQELLNNIVKHAAARTALVQIAATSNQLTITVEDDGSGFDTRELKAATGIGWKNILSRVDYHKGTLSIQSGKEKGTSVYIEFALV